jgi:hypothetical protein
MDLTEAKQLIEAEKKDRAKKVSEEFERLLKDNNCKYGIDLQLQNNVIVPTLYFIAD